MQTLGVSRLVTLTGGGGVGKSRLAQAAETAWAAQCHPYLTCRVDLAIETPLPWVSAALLKEEQETDPRAALARSIWDCSLLVLDNGDQAKSPYAPSLRNLLRLCPNLRVLVTSRTALGIPGEVPIPLLPLRVPTPIEAQSCSKRVDLLTQFASVQLFLQVLKTLQPRFEMTEENAGEVASICYSQDGVPRSLEFAAAVMAHYCYPIDKPASSLLIQETENIVR